MVHHNSLIIHMSKLTVALAALRVGGNPRVWMPMRTRKSRGNRGRSRLGRLERLLNCQEWILGCPERILGCLEQILSLPGTGSGLQAADSGLPLRGSGLPGADSGLPGIDSEHAWNGFWAAWPARTAFRAAGGGFWVVRKRTEASFEDAIRSHEAQVSKFRAS